MDWAGAVAIVALGASWGVWAWAWAKFRSVPDDADLEAALAASEETSRRLRQELADFTDRFERASRRWDKRAQREGNGTSAAIADEVIARAMKFSDPRKRARVLAGASDGVGSSVEPDDQ